MYIQLCFVYGLVFFIDSEKPFQEITVFNQVKALIIPFTSVMNVFSLFQA